MTHADTASPVTRHRLRSHRTVTVLAPDERGEADPRYRVHSLHQVEVNGLRTHLIHSEPEPCDFEVAITHPVARELPSWAAWLGATRAEPVLMWAVPMPPPSSQPWWTRLSRRLLVGVGLGLLLLGGLAWWHAPADASAWDLLASRHGLAAGLLLVLAGWYETVRHLRRLSVDLRPVHRLFQYPMAEVPGGFEAAAGAQITLGDTLLRVVRGQVDEVTHWLHPGPTYPGARRQPQRRFRFHMDGRRFEGRTAHRGIVSHPFLVPGDEVRVAVQPSGDGGWQVVALANLADGHLVFDETDERLRTFSDPSGAAMVLLGLGAAALLTLWLGVGATADEISLVLFPLCLGLALWIGTTSAWRRHRRGLLAKALGARRHEQKSRRLAVTPLPLGGR